MCLDFHKAQNTYSASAIASTEKEEVSFAHVGVIGFRTSDLKWLSFQLPDLKSYFASQALPW